MKNLATLLTTLLTIAALFALTGWQITGETASTRLLGRLGASIIEIDRWLPAHEEDIKLVARDGEAGGVILVRDLPIEVTLPSALVIDAEQSTLRTLITQEMGRRLYEDGTGAFRDNEGETASLGINEPVRWTVTLLGSGMHGFWLAAMALTLLLALAAAAAVMSTGPIPCTRLLSPPSSARLARWLLGADAPGRSSTVSSAADREIVLILRDGAFMGVRNCGGVAFASGILAFLMSMGRGRSAGDRNRPHDVDHLLPHGRGQTSPSLSSVRCSPSATASEAGLRRPIPSRSLPLSSLPRSSPSPRRQTGGRMLAVSRSCCWGCS